MRKRDQEIIRRAVDKIMLLSRDAKVITSVWS